MKCVHAMPFGAELQKNGKVRFALWAPGATQVDLCLNEEADEMILPMVSHANGWFKLSTDQAAVDSRYRFRIDKNLRVPDPVSRFQPQDIHDPSLVLNPEAFNWQDGSWPGRSWEEAVIYELHVGAFSPQGNYDGVTEQLDYLQNLGVTAIELMPLADFPGKRNWGYDGALLFAPDSSYGSPDELKNLIQEAHSREIMMLLDVVYNHFGPDGNYLYVYAREAFFDNRYQTPWGEAVNFSGTMSRTVRDFFIHNALYWLEEYHFDGLRLDAVHAIFDDSSPDILEEIAEKVRKGPGRNRHIHLILENDNNEARYLKRNKKNIPVWYTAQWNDDIHHALHVLLTGEKEGYYIDYADNPIHHLGRCLAQGFAYQGEISSYRDYQCRGEKSGQLPPTAFVSFLQNHDQVGNRAFGRRLTELTSERPLLLATILLLLSPAPPLFFMGDEFGATTPFLYFCDFGPDLAPLVTEGRRQEFARFSSFAEPKTRKTIPDPNSPQTFQRSILNWNELYSEQGRKRHRLYRSLLRFRRQYIVPLLSGIQGDEGQYKILGTESLSASWTLADGAHLEVYVNFSTEMEKNVAIDLETILYDFPEYTLESGESAVLPAESIVWVLKERERK